MSVGAPSSGGHRPRGSLSALGEIIERQQNAIGDLEGRRPGGPELGKRMDALATEDRPAPNHTRIPVWKKGEAVPDPGNLVALSEVLVAPGHPDPECAKPAAELAREMQDAAGVAIGTGTRYIPPRSADSLNETSRRFVDAVIEHEVQTQLAVDRAERARRRAEAYADRMLDPRSTPTE